MNGILSELEKLNKLLDYEYLAESILIPAVEHSHERGIINKQESQVLKKAISLKKFKSSDLDISSMTSRQKTHVISKLKENKFIRASEKGGRSYYVNFTNNYLMRYVILLLEKEKFIPPIDK